MNTRKNQILRLLIVGALAVIGTGATEAYAVAVVIPVQTKAKLAHPALSSPLLLQGTANVQVAGGTVNLGSYTMIAPGIIGSVGEAKIWWFPATVNPDGSFTARGRGTAKFINPLTGGTEFVSFCMITNGRTDSVVRAMGRFNDSSSSVAGSHLKGKYHH